MAQRCRHLGIDFDNTIVSYDGVFHRVALERGCIPSSVGVSKVAVRDWLRQTGKEEIWTEMQGHVYGARMRDADLYPGVREVLAAARDTGLVVSIVSHKTRYPFLGEKHDLHAAARAWVEEFLRDDAGPFVEPDRIFFETTKEAKWARIGAADVSHFVDDLPEILLSEHFPADVEKILFDPDRHHGDLGPGVTIIHGWDELGQRLLACP